MTDIILFHTPGTCARVTMNALEEIGVAFEDRAVNLMVGEQRSPQYLAVNPKGKVPALKLGNQVHTENAAILYLLHLHYPAANLLPAIGEAVTENEPLEDLVWCSSTLHPLVRQVRIPSSYTAGDAEGVKANAMGQLPPKLEQIAQRVAHAGWWYGDRWSILDVYLYWIYSSVGSAGIDLSAWPALANHTARVRARPSFERALARETAAIARHGIRMPPGASL